MQTRTRARLIALTAAALSLSSTTQALAVPPTPPPPVINYVALGDSVPAGVGVDPDEAYPAILDARSGRLLGVNEALSAAGANQIASEIANFEADHPGGLEGVTKVTLTVGVNDLSFGDVVSSCLQLPDCSELEGAVDHALAVLVTRLTNALAKIHEKFPNARIYVSGYYELFGSKNRVCELTDELSITPASMRFLNVSAGRLNATIASTVRAAQADGVPARYVDVASVFNGHGLCDSARPWVFGFDNLSIATHPNRYGQAAYAAMFRATGVR